MCSNSRCCSLLFLTLANKTFMFGYVFYPDGGCRPQNEYSGAGIHGYRWNLKLTPKGIGHTTHSASLRGYDPKADTFEFANKETKNATADLTREEFQQWILEDSAVKIPQGTESIAANGVLNQVWSNLHHRVPLENYYDCFIPLEFGGTNNTAELMAAVHCLERMLETPDIADCALIVIRQDSKYVVDGHNVYLPNWINNNFTRRDGTMVGHPNMWMRMNAASQAIQAMGVKLIFEWVRGHGSCIGNNSADDLATAAVFTSKSQKAVDGLDDSFRVSDVTDYWGSRSELRHPMLCFRYGFIGVDEAEKERTEYYLSTQGKLEEMNGKRGVDGFSVVRCAPQRHIEDIVTKQVSLPREVDYKFQFDLDNIYGGDSRYLGLYGTDFLHRALEHKRHLQTYGKLLVTKELHPPFLSERVFDNMDILADFLDDYQKDDQPTLQTTDITDSFFVTTEEEVKVKKGEDPRTKLVCTLKPEIVVGFSKLPVQGRWKEATGEVKECELMLRLGVDLPDRNALRRMESYLPKVYLLSNTIGPGSFMYAVIIEAGEDVGIWSGMNSSIRITAKTPPKAKAVGKAA